MNRISKRTRQIITASILGAIYAAFTFAIAPIAYGWPMPLEFRVSEALCILPFFFPAATPGLFVGCVIANLLSPVGILDVVFGSLASLLAGLCTGAIGARARALSPDRKIGWGSCIAACAMPVVFNAPIVGALLSYSFTPENFWTGFFTFGASVGLGEAVILFALGLPLMRIILRNAKFSAYFERLR